MRARMQRRQGAAPSSPLLPPPQKKARTSGRGDSSKYSPDKGVVKAFP